jgi:stalled ribosome rescue protein Dom34
MKQKITRSEILTMAWAIRRQNPLFTWSQCQVQAWKVARLRASLRTGVASFTFQNNEGEVRAAKGTLNTDLFQYDYKGTKRGESVTVVKYFDLEKNAWRSFRADRFLTVAA